MISSCVCVCVCVSHWTRIKPWRMLWNRTGVLCKDENLLSGWIRVSFGGCLCPQSYRRCVFSLPSIMNDHKLNDLNLLSYSSIDQESNRASIKLKSWGPHSSWVSRGWSISLPFQLLEAALPSRPFLHPLSQHLQFSPTLISLPSFCKPVYSVMSDPLRPCGL